MKRSDHETAKVIGVLATLVLLLGAGCGRALREATCAPAPHPRIDPITGTMAVPRSAEDFSFLIGGHLYGDPAALDPLPSPILVRSVDRIAAGPDRFLVSVGDYLRSFLDITRTPTHQLLERLGIPVFNAPGNHDFDHPDRHRELQGNGYGCFAYGTALIVILNTEIVPWNITDEQLDFFERAVAYARDTPGIRHAAFFAHKVIFAAADPRYRILWDHPNARDQWSGRSNFRSDIRPLLAELAATKHVLWCAGDLGMPYTLPLFWDKDPRTGITFIATGMGGLERDALVRVRVETNAGFALQTVALGADPPGPITNFGIEYWIRHFASQGREGR